MWTAPHGPVALAAPEGGGGAVHACSTRSIELLDCEPSEPSIASDWAFNGPAPHQPKAASIASIDTNGKAPPEPPQEGSETHVTFTVALVSDYRRGGVSRSDRKPALQGGVDVRLPHRWNIGVRGSSIAEHGNVEVVLYGAKTIALGETDLTFGVSANTFPYAPHSNFGMAQASASRAIGPVDATLSVIYAWEQPNLEHEDSLYVVARARTPIGRLMGVPVTLGASVGRMRGRFAMADSRSDWSASLTGRVGSVDIGVSYIDNDLGDSRGDPAAVLSITHSF